jgi:hypothetical protein
MKKLNLLFCLVLLAFTLGNAQTIEQMTIARDARVVDLNAIKPTLDSLQKLSDALKAEIADLTEKIKPYPRVEMSASGNLGFDFSSFNNWLSKSQPNTTAFNIAFAGNGEINYLQEKYFWRNHLNLTMGWLQFDDRDDPVDDDAFKVTADASTLNSLFGYKLSEKFALSAMAEYRTSLLDGRFNEPGYLDLGAGGTWTPIKDLIVVVHPLDYNFVFSTGAYDFKSTFGCKIVADYKTQLGKHLAWKSNLSAFASYEGNDFSNWTWTNGLTTSVKGLGLGFDFGLRGNRQEAEAYGLENNPLQTYWIVGISYGL